MMPAVIFKYRGSVDPSACALSIENSDSAKKWLQLHFLGNLERRIEFGFEITRSTFYFRMP
jgi:hypothetical protein